LSITNLTRNTSLFTAQEMTVDSVLVQLISAYDKNKLKQTAKTVHF